MIFQQQLLMLALGMLFADKGASKPFQLHKSTDHGHHVTIEERPDYYLVRANVRVDLPRALFQAGAKQLELKLLTSEGSAVNRKVPLTGSKEIWRFYFKAPKHENVSTVRYGLVAQAPGATMVTLAVWEVRDGKVSLGSEKVPLTVKYQVEIPITQEIAPGQIKVKRVKETRFIGNDYKAPPIVGMLPPDKKLPELLTDEAMTVRLSPK